eukprot:4226750-Prymnesium_polylepis.1
MPRQPAEPGRLMTQIGFAPRSAQQGYMVAEELGRARAIEGRRTWVPQQLWRMATCGRNVGCGPPSALW